MEQAGHVFGEDEVALLALLPADGTPADSNEIRDRLGWASERYGAAVPTSPGDGVANSNGFQIQVDAYTQDVTVTVNGEAGNA